MQYSVYISSFIARPGLGLTFLRTRFIGTVFTSVLKEKYGCGSQPIAHIARKGSQSHVSSNIVKVCLIGTLCDDFPEDTLHLLRDCVHVQSIWRHFLNSKPNKIEWFVDTEDWMRENLRPNLYSHSPYNIWHITYGGVVWHIRKHRNSFILENTLIHEKKANADALANIGHNVLGIIFSANPFIG
ncbi:hypothetical protein VNO78_10246 [Psophocarpus tetragonolobus]|uniref:Uncharacterized protein n=1 Tax=Psophocarpus tetragonolobus TaxID=3891 RepID=A0AAN9XMD5_PSOTE